MQIYDMIQQIKEYQKELGQDFDFKTTEEQMAHFRNIALALHCEVTEAVDWMPWKPWRPIEGQNKDKVEAAYELIDVFFFTINLWLTLGLPAASFEEYFKVKLEENKRRIQRGYNHNLKEVKS